jgi:hypothetical protein
MLFVLCDALPRATSILVASLLLLAIPSPDVYGWINILGSVVAVGIPFIIAVHRARRMGVSTGLGGVRAAFAALRRGLPIVGSVLVMVLRISFAVIAAPFIAPAGAAQVSLGDKFFRWANTAMTPVMQTLLARIPRVSGTLVARARIGMLIAWTGGLLLGTGTVVVIRWLSGVISHGQIVLDFSSAAPIGIAAGMVFIAGITGNSVLVMFGRVGQVFASGLTALVVLLTASVVLGLAFGATGMLWAFALSESVVVIYQSIVLVGEFRRARASRRAATPPAAG